MRITGRPDEPVAPRRRGRVGGLFNNLRRPATPAGPAQREIDWRHYDPVAEAYARVQAPRTALVAADLVSLAGLGPGARVLDVGTGTGAVARAAAEAVGPDGLVVGVDPALSMLLSAAADPAGPWYVQAEALDLPFPNQSFDRVLAAFVITHFTRYETALFDMLRVLKPRGRLGVATWGPSHDEFSRAWDEVAHEFAGREMLADAQRRAMPWSDRFSDRGRLKDALYEAGVRDIVVERREYRFRMTAEDYLVSREISAAGRFLHQMLGERLWSAFQRRTRETFAQHFPDTFNDFRDVNLAVGTKP